MDATLQLEKREGRGKNEANRLRAAGKIPAVVYGSKDGKGAEGKGKQSKGKDGQSKAAKSEPEAVAVAVDPKALLRILHSESGANTLITIKLDGGESRVMVKEYQLDPITHALLHADFYQLAMDKAIRVTVPILVLGEARGVKTQGGLLDFVTREIEIEVLPTDIPEHIDVDVSEMLLHESIRLRDLPENPKWKPLTEPDTMLVHVVLPKAEESAATTAVAAEGAAPVAAEPEVIKKGKTEEKEEEKKK
jgi:large subunit ribosomal protein L25